MATYEQKQQAWKVVDQAVARLQITREQHVGLQHAMQLLKPDNHIADAGKKVDADTPEHPGPEDVKK